MKPVVFGTSGLALTDEEKDFFREAQPAGYIIFGRNIESPQQLRSLTDSLRDLHGDDKLLVMIDQEGGRVARMKAPVWPSYPAPGKFDALYNLAPISAMEAVRANYAALACDLAAAGINVDCAPMIDVRQPDSNEAVIGDRAFGEEPQRVAALGRAALDGLRDGGVLGVVKHMPGHGRARVDSHHNLPIVEADDAQLTIDLEPFQRLNNAEMGMTGHIVFPAWDDNNPATLSPFVVQNIIRERIGFDGLLFTDDLDMKALSGSVPDRAVAAIAAGCDIALNCWGKMDDMREMAERLPDMSAATAKRFARVRAALPVAGKSPAQDDWAAKRDSLMALV